jgi:serine/threonine protein kinase
MTQPRTCPKCGVALAPDVPEGTCAACDLRAALEPEDLATSLAPDDAGLGEGEGATIGRYKLLQKIGEGGFGVVYMADQEEPVRRRVALKIIKLGMDTKEVIARFEAERQALALMDHPNIARILDGGATDSGLPYFVMELVRGVRITDFCDQHRYSPKQRLELFMQVCQAVQHAHQKGIIHRDLKPSNILVTLNDGVPVPKVIDFGIAKATQQRLTDKTVFTRFLQFLGTPAYMSPEQVEMTSLDIDTRSDIYSLGVLLYEFLTGKTPFDGNELLKAGLDEMRQRIREEEPLKPSTRLSTLQEAECQTAAIQRGVEAPKLINLLRGDLDWIVMKCLEKDRARRYEAAHSIAADIECHLKNEPVLARPPSSAYRFTRFLRRQRTAVNLFGAFLAFIITITAYEFISYRNAMRQMMGSVARLMTLSLRAPLDFDATQEVRSDLLLLKSEPKTGYARIGKPPHSGSGLLHPAFLRWFGCLRWSAIGNGNRVERRREHDYT